MYINVLPGLSDGSRKRERGHGPAASRHCKSRGSGVGLSRAAGTLNFRHLEVFYAIMTHGTVTEAAHRLGVSQPSVTTTIKQAEARLGIELFHRKGGRLVPTAEARQLFEEAERAHESLAAFEIIAERLRVRRGGYVRIAAVPTISLELLPDAIVEFQRHYPDFRYSVSTLNTEEIVHQMDSRKGTFNLGFTIGRVADNALTYSDIGESEVLVVIPADWEVPDDDEIELAALQGRPFVSSFEHTALAIESRRLFANSNIEPTIVARSHSYHLAGALVQRGIGYTLLEALTVRTILDSKHGAPVIVRRIRGNPAMPVSAIVPSQRQLSNPVKAFITSFQKAFEAIQAGDAS